MMVDFFDLLLLIMVIVVFVGMVILNLLKIFILGWDG